MRNTVLTFIFFILNLCIINAQSIDARLVPAEAPSAAPDLYCMNIELMGSGGADYIGGSSIFLSFDSDVVSFSGYTEYDSTGQNIIVYQTTGTYTSFNFDNDQATLHPDCSTFELTPYTAHSYDAGTDGQILITTFLNQKTIVTGDGSEIIFACPSIENTWIKMSEICFEINDQNGNPNIQFIGDQNAPPGSYGTNFNSDTNEPSDKYNNGTLTPWTTSYNAYFTTTSAAPENDDCSAATALSMPTEAGVVAYNGPFTNIDATVSENDPVDQITCDASCFNELEFGTPPCVNGNVWFTLLGDGKTYHVYTNRNCGAFTLSDGDYIDNGDTQMAVFTGSCDGLSLIACNEDDDELANATDFLAGLNIETTAGVTYYVMIDGLNALEGLATGQFCVNIEEVAAGGCTDPCASNFDSNAISDDGSCEPYSTECDSDPCTNGGLYVWNQGACECQLTEVSIFGCTVTTACNYNPDANCDDGSCDLGITNCPDPCDAIPGCTDDTACNYNPDANCNDGSCEPGMTDCPNPCDAILGCTDDMACNFNPDANCDDGSCEDAQNCSVDLSISKDIIQIDATPIVGSFVTYLITVTNEGTADATGVIVEDMLPSQLSFFSSEASSGAYSPSSANWTIGNIDFGTSLTLEIVGKIEAIGDVVNVTQVIACNEQDLDSTPANDTGSQPEDDEAAIGFIAVEDVVQEILGCTDSIGCNYNAEATVDDGSCIFPITWYEDADGDGLGDPESTLYACSQPDGYVDIASGINDLENIIGQMTLAPNPASNFIYLQFENIATDQLNLSIYDISSKMIHKDVIEGNNSYKLSVEDFATGTYFVVLNNGSKSASYKFIVE